MSEPPDAVDDLEETRALQRRLAKQVLDVAGVDGPPWDVELLFGDPATELGRLGERLDAVMIVVGTREAGVGRAALGEFFGGSVAVHLAHRQHRPVLVVPVHPVITPEELPWRAASDPEEGSPVG
jgi:nucleotide-binding universal stress UspA family protein